MSKVGKKVRENQNRIIALLQNEFQYRYLGNREERADWSD